jgi:hypothetical protein
MSPERNLNSKPAQRAEPVAIWKVRKFIEKHSTEQRDSSSTVPLKDVFEP